MLLGPPPEARGDVVPGDRGATRQPMVRRQNADEWFAGEWEVFDPRVSERRRTTG